MPAAFCTECGAPLSVYTRSCPRCGRDVRGRGPGAADPRLRASHDERENVVEALRSHGADGRLTTDELEERVRLALQAVTRADLDALVTDLPATAIAPRPDQAREYADFGQRAAGAVIDAVAVGAITSAIGSGEAWFVVSAAYHTTFLAIAGRTPGKMAAGIRVVRTDGSRAGLGPALVRETAGRVVSALTLFVGYLFPLWDRRRQTLHDKVAGTIVVRDRLRGTR